MWAKKTLEQQLETLFWWNTWTTLGLNIFCVGGAYWSRYFKMPYYDDFVTLQVGFTVVGLLLLLLIVFVDVTQTSKYAKGRHDQ